MWGRHFGVISAVSTLALLACSRPGQSEQAWSLPSAPVAERDAAEIGTAPSHVAARAPKDQPAAVKSAPLAMPDPAEPVAQPGTAGLLSGPSGPSAKLAGALVLTAQGTKGAPDDSTAGVHKFEVAVEADIAPGIKAFGNIEAVSGDGPGALAASYSELNANGGTTDDGFALGEAWVELARGSLTVTLGKIDMAAYVDANELANDETTQFISGSLVNSLAIILPDGCTPGVAVTYATGPWHATLGVASADESSDALLDEVVGVFELGCAFGAGGVKGNARLTTAIDGAGDDASGDAAGDMSVGLSLDVGFGEKSGLFARWGKRGVDAVGVEVESAWSAGAEFRPFASRADDTIGLAYGAATSPAGESEGLFELYYKAALSESAALSLHAQALTNAECNPAAETVLAFGARTLIEF